MQKMESAAAQHELLTHTQTDQHSTTAVVCAVHHRNHLAAENKSTTTGGLLTVDLLACDALNVDDPLLAVHLGHLALTALLNDGQLLSAACSCILLCAAAAAAAAALPRAAPRMQRAGCLQLWLLYLLPAPCCISGVHTACMRASLHARLSASLAFQLWGCLHGCCSL